MSRWKAEILLKIAFIAGAIIDAVAVFPMLIPSLAKRMWGFDNTGGDYSFAMRMGASLMLGWTVLLLWAAIKPMQRRHIAPFTVIVILGIASAEIFAVTDGSMPLELAIPSFIMQTLLTALFLTAFFASRKPMGAA